MTGETTAKLVPTLARYGLPAGLAAAALAFVLVPAALSGGPAPGYWSPLAVTGAGLTALGSLALVGTFLFSRSAAPPPADLDSAPLPSSVPDMDDMVGMLDDTLLIARDPAATADRMEPVDVGALLAGLQGAYDGARLTLSGTHRDLVTLAHRSSLERVFEILIENALSNGSRAAVLCDRGTEALVVHVDDDGPGVGRADRSRVFDWRYYMTTPPSQRTGCRAELVVARQITRTCGGDVTVVASPFGGARFSVRLPVCEATAATLQAAS